MELTACAPPPLFLGCSSPSPCANPHGREAISMRDLWNALPAPADVEEPLAHPHWRKALPCKLAVNRLRQVAELIYLDFFFLKLFFLFFFSVWKMQLALPSQESAEVASSAKARRHHQHQDPVPHVDGRHAHWLDKDLLKGETGAKLRGGNLDLGI